MIRKCDYTQEQREFLAEGYKHMTAAELADAFNERYGTRKTAGAIHARLTCWGVKSGRTGRFGKGNKPWNSGKQGVNGHSETRFKRGQLPPTTKPLYHERVDPRDGVIWIKYRMRGNRVGEHNYKPKHVWLWEQENGPVPDGHIVRFVDGDTRNFSPENLICVSRHVHLILNRKGFSGVPEEYRDSALLTAKLEEKIYQAKSGGAA